MWCIWQSEGAQPEAMKDFGDLLLVQRASSLHSIGFDETVEGDGF